MADFKFRRVEPGQTKIRNVPIAVTPEGFWCCPSQVVLQKSLKSQGNNQTKPKASSPPPTKPLIDRAPAGTNERRQPSGQLRSAVLSEDQRVQSSDAPATASSDRKPKTPSGESRQRKISIGFGQPETSDIKVALSGKEGIAVRVSVHRDVLVEHSRFFLDKLSNQPSVSSVALEDCDDVEIFVDTMGLMYCKDMKQRLFKQSVPRVLRIAKAAESLGFHSCTKACLEYLEAAPWVGEEEENVVSLIRSLPTDKYGVSPIMRRVSSTIPGAPIDTLAHILELILRSTDDRGRCEMKSLVLRLLRESGLLVHGHVDVCIETLYGSCQSCLYSLLVLFKQASEPEFADKPFEEKDPVSRQVTLEVDSLLWLVDILADRRRADDFVIMWASRNELAALHPKLPKVSRHLVSRITARLFIGIGKGEMLPSKDVRRLLLNVWLQPLIDDYSWMQHGCRSFDRKAVEDGIGRTILTLPLEDQQAILLSWLGSFLKVGDSCPNLQRAFEVWWRRTFVRPYAATVEQQREGLIQPDSGNSLRIVMFQ